MGKLRNSFELADIGNEEQAIALTAFARVALPRNHKDRLARNTFGRFDVFRPGYGEPMHIGNLIESMITTPPVPSP
jgi:hypothetical protein